MPFESARLALRRPTPVLEGSRSATMSTPPTGYFEHGHARYFQDRFITRARPGFSIARHGQSFKLPSRRSGASNVAEVKASRSQRCGKIRYLVLRPSAELCAPPHVRWRISLPLVARRHLLFQSDRDGNPGSSGNVPTERHAERLPAPTRRFTYARLGLP